MNIAQMLDLKDGDQVKYISGPGHNGSWPEMGTTLTRESVWLDDDHSVQFSWEGEFGKDTHFFRPSDIEFIKE